MGRNVAKISYRILLSFLREKRSARPQIAVSRLCRRLAVLPELLTGLTDAEAFRIARLPEAKIALRAHCGGRIRYVGATQHGPSPTGCRPQNTGLGRDLSWLAERELTDARPECAFRTSTS